MSARRTLLRLAAGLAAALAAAVALAQGAPAQRPLTLVHADWSSSVASANVVKAVLQERLGIPVVLRQTTAERMWEAVADGRADAMLSAWLPATHAGYRERYGDRIEDLGPNLEGARIGLVVPAVSVGRQTAATGRTTRPYVTAESIADLPALRSRFGGRIVGIDPGAGIMQRTREAMAAYGLTGYRLIEGSEGSMTRALSEAIRRQEWIVVTGWVPHWMFARWNLRFLDDPLQAFGGEESIHTLVRKGLAAERPAAYKVLDRFRWSPDDMGRMLIWNEQDGGHDPYAKALRWARTHDARVRAWTE